MATTKELGPKAERILGLLLGVAERRGTITYSRLANLVGVESRWN
jgi:hypothetical protein